MLVIRLARVGKKKKPEFRILVQEKARDPYGVFVDRVGYYNPRTVPATIRLDKEKILAWIKKGAQPSATVHNILINLKILDGKKQKVVRHHRKIEEKKTSKSETKPQEAARA